MRRVLIVGVILATMISPVRLAAATVSLSQTILPIRALILNEQGAIISIWSNVNVISSQYVLTAFQLHLGGPNVPVSPTAFARYRQLLPSLPASHVGQIYPAPRQSSSDRSPNLDRQLIAQPDGSWQEVVTLLSL